MYPAAAPPASSALKSVAALRFLLTFKGVTSVVYAGLWLGWLSRLTKTGRSGHRRCRDVEPAWRAALSATAWVFAVITAVYACAAMTFALLASTASAAAMNLLLTLVSVALVGVYGCQIQYLDAMADSSAPSDRCDEVSPWSRTVVTVFAAAVGVFGAVLAAAGAYCPCAYFQRLMKASVPA